MDKVLDKRRSILHLGNQLTFKRGNCPLTKMFRPCTPRGLAGVVWGERVVGSKWIRQGNKRWLTGRGRGLFSRVVSSHFKIHYLSAQLSDQHWRYVGKLTGWISETGGVAVRAPWDKTFHAQAGRLACGLECRLVTKEILDRYRWRHWDWFRFYMNTKL